MCLDRENGGGDRPDAGSITTSVGDREHRNILICHITMVDQGFIKTSNMNNLAMDFGQQSALHFCIRHLWGK